jgi:alpha-L-fucosidase
MVKYLPDRCIAWPGHHGGVGPDQEYRQTIDGTLRWYPGEPSLILQGNWFHNRQPAVSVRQMQDYYLTSVGYGVTPLMNISPNADGLIDDDTVAKLKEFKAWVDKLHANDLARTGKVTADSCRGGKYSPANVVDGKYDTYFATADNVTNAVIEVTLPKPQKVDGFILQEYIPLGQRVTGYSLECRVDGQWVPVFAGNNIGYKRIILEGRANAAGKKFPVTDAIRLKIESARACPLISTFQVIGGV